MKNAKKFFSLAMVLCMVLSLAPTAVYAENTGNLLQNGGFETAEDHVATGWDYAGNLPNNYSSEAGKNAFVVTKDAEAKGVHSGNQALKLVSGNESGTTGRWISQKVTGLTPGKAYRASAWVYIDGTLTGKGLMLRIADSNGTSDNVGLAGSNGERRGFGGLLTTTGDVWKNVSCAFVPTVIKDTDGKVTYDATFAYICLDFGQGATTEVNVYVDDITFEAISDLNGDFEDTEYTVSGDTASKIWAKGWGTSNGTKGSKQTFVGEHAFVAANAGQNGSNALCITTTEATARELHAYIPVTGLTTGKMYRVSCYIKSSSAESTATTSLNAINKKSDSGDLSQIHRILQLAWGGSNMIEKSVATTTPNQWTQLSFVFAAVDTYTFIGLAAKPAQNECIYFDNVTIEETNICFTTTDGTVLGETLLEAGSVNAKATVIGAQGDTARIFVGIYETVSGTPRLADVYLSDSITLLAKKWADITIENISLAEGQYAKAMLLDSAAGLQPLTEAKTLTVSAS